MLAAIAARVEGFPLLRFFCGIRAPFCAAFTRLRLQFGVHQIIGATMFLSLFAFPAPLATATAFVVGGAAGVLWTRFSRSQRAQHGLPLVGANAPMTFSSHTAESLRLPSAPWLNGTAAARDARSARLPLPQRVTEPAAADGPSLALVNLFVDRLAELPTHEWLEVGRNWIADGARPPQRAAAIEMLDATICAHGLEVAAWYARDAVETSAFLATQRTPRWAATERRIFAAAHGAAEKAALAVLAHDLLAPEQLATLLAPFERALSSSGIIPRLTKRRDFVS